MKDQIYNHSSEGPEMDIPSLERKWRRIWKDLQPFTAEDPQDTNNKSYKYVLDMFPYPSGDLHMGHARQYALGDAMARYYRHKGHCVLHPIGWDSFGLPAENAAIKNNGHPHTWTYQNIKQQKSSMYRYAVGFDWERVIHTSDPEYYKWNQWLFLQLFNAGLAYKKESYVNWDPIDQTVLANEQILPDGTSERSGAVVVQKKLKQWFFKITDYAKRLLDDLDKLEGKWPSKVILMQKNWIGKKEGFEVQFSLSEDGSTKAHSESISVFFEDLTHLPHTQSIIIDATSTEAEKLIKLNSPSCKAQFDQFLEFGGENAGIFRFHHTAINPLTQESVPIFASINRTLDLAEHQTQSSTCGSVCAVLDTPSKEDLPPVKDADLLSKIENLKLSGVIRSTIKFRLRDWLISRQRYWGTPIPILYDQNGQILPVAEKDLPVLLPDNDNLDLKPKGKSPLEAATTWQKVIKDGKEYFRDCDTMDTFVDSSWYFLRFLSPNDDTRPFDPVAAKKWMPVACYVGGVEHAIMHLLYARFITKVLFDLGFIDFDEPFLELKNQGMVLMDGSKMSKSKGNTVKLSEELDALGTDVVRTMMLFAAPAEDDFDWADIQSTGIIRFLEKCLNLSSSVSSPAGVDLSNGSRTLKIANAQFLHSVDELIKAFKFNVAIARCMELLNTIRKEVKNIGYGDPSVRQGVEYLALVLDLFAPITAEQMWENLGYQPSIAKVHWPEIDPSLLSQQETTAIVQFNGKLRHKITVPTTITKEALEELVREDPIIKEKLSTLTVRGVVVKPPQLINFLVG